MIFLNIYDIFIITTGFSDLQSISYFHYIINIYSNLKLNLSKISSEIQIGEGNKSLINDEEDVEIDNENEEDEETGIEDDEDDGSGTHDDLFY